MRLGEATMEWGSSGVLLGKGLPLGPLLVWQSSRQTRPAQVSCAPRKHRYSLLEIEINLRRQSLAPGVTPGLCTEPAMPSPFQTTLQAALWWEPEQ